MLRRKWGPDLTDAYDVPTETPGLVDVELTYVKSDPATGEVHLELPLYDPTTHVQPDRVYLLLVPAGSHPPTDPDQAVDGGAYPLSHVDVALAPAGSPVVLPRPATVKPGASYTGKTVLEFGKVVPQEPAPATTG